MQEPIYDVAVVGAGPVGLAVARMLGLAGHSVIVLERWPSLYPLPRAVHFDHEIGRVFQAMGLRDEIEAISAPVPDHYEWRNRNGDSLVRIDWSGLGPSGWPVANFFSQPELEQVLGDAVAAMPQVAVRRGREVIRLAAEPDQDVVLTHTGADGATAQTRARYVIGADGTNSFVREQMSTSMQDLGFYFDWLIVDTIPQDDLVWSPQNWQLCDPIRPTTIVSGGPGRRRWEFMRLPGESLDDLNRSDTAWRLMEPWGRTPANTVLERHAVYTFQARWADHWNEGRLFLVGDAAHNMPPFAGQGMCSGIRDAANLSWKLDRVLRGQSDPALLNTYTSERLTHIQHAIAMSVELGKVICVLDEEAAAQRDARMIAGNADPAVVLPISAQPVLGPGVVATGIDLPGLRGTLSPQFRAELDGRTALLDDLVGANTAMLLTTDAQLPETLGEQARAELADLGVRLLVLARFTPASNAVTPIATAATLIDADDEWHSWFTQFGATAALVRADDYIFGAVPDIQAVDGLISQYSRHLRAQVHPSADLATQTRSN
ncbi:bifunctional 3-(3-hydroxy-phenyl)propionate/3-hydroxycinnamic acid hydroxylase [Nocardia sp. CA-107356]|uniref:bifunctional 3-(3-hydroxy-phenyl)propionate/3-hydroxycinnamic acid hydroxylase MhpA n=1 Tax=Nocardia sp. CA-107356 TaxID=3239972 RepID=UPI003D8D42EB